MNRAYYVEWDCRVVLPNVNDSNQLKSRFQINVFQNSIKLALTDGIRNKPIYAALLRFDYPLGKTK